MAETLVALKAAGFRDRVKVMIDGVPVTAAYAGEIGANADVAVERAKSR